MDGVDGRDVLRDQSDTSNDDQNSYLETQGLLSTLYINTIIFIAFMTFHEMNRHMRPIYLKRLTTKFKVDRYPIISSNTVLLMSM